MQSGSGRVLEEHRHSACHPPDEVVDDVAAAGVAAAVAEPALGGVTHHQGGRVADAAVAAALPETR